MEVWLAARGIGVVDVAREADLNRNSVYNLIWGVGSARHSTLSAIASAMSSASGQTITADQVAALAHRRVVDPDRVSEEIAEALGQPR